jgi:hypothetical protein
MYPGLVFLWYEIAERGNAARPSPEQTSARFPSAKYTFLRKPSPFPFQPLHTAHLRANLEGLYVNTR